DRGQDENIDALRQHVHDLARLKRFRRIGGLSQHVQTECGGLLFKKRLISILPAKLVVIWHDQSNLEPFALCMSSLQTDNGSEQCRPGDAERLPTVKAIPIDFLRHASLP